MPLANPFCGVSLGGRAGGTWAGLGGELLLLQEEYIREHISWREISFADNQPCINLISLKPYGILRILDDQCCFPQVSHRRCVSLVWLLNISELHVLIRPKSCIPLCSGMGMGSQDTQHAIHNLG